MDNIYDGCGIINSNIIKKEFKGFEKGKVYCFDNGVVLKVTLLNCNINKYKEQIRKF